ncbi:MAG: hypothetical protein ABJI85_10570, partial [Reichenbachiella sp.]
LCFTLSNPAFSQHKSFSKEHDIWLDGYVYLSTGEKVKGKINYNFVSETIRVDKNSRIKTYAAKNVSRFAVFDSIRTKSLYYSFPYSYYAQSKMLGISNKTSGSIDIKSSTKKYHFFLVIHQNDKAAILSNLEIDYATKHRQHMTYQHQGSSSKLSRYEKVLERIFIINKKVSPSLILEGKIEKNNTIYINPFSQFSKYDHTAFKPSEKENPDFTESAALKSARKYKLFNKDFLEELDSKNYRKLEAYIEKEDIDIKTVEGLILVFDYWSDI